MEHRSNFVAACRRALAQTAKSGGFRRLVFARACGVAALVAMPGLAWTGILPPGFVRLKALAPDVAEEMRYAGSHNFTGKPVPGYRAAQCWLRVEAARALAAAQAEARVAGLELVVYDCYRPRRAVTAFVAWSKNDDEGSKAAYFPRVEKHALFEEGYIAEKSGHSTGLAVDLGVRGWDFGTPFDFFDRRSWTNAPGRGAARIHRSRLVALMRRHGFDNYPREWWHFTLHGAKNIESYDVEIE